MTRYVLRTVAWILLMGTCALAPRTVAGDAAPPTGSGWITGVVQGATLKAPCRVEVALWRPDRTYPHGFAHSSRATQARLMLPPGPAAPTREATTTRGGAFALRDLGSGTYLVRATSPAGRWGSAVVRLRANGQHVHVAIAMHAATEVLTGRLVFKDGRPFQGVAIASLEPPVWNPDLVPQPANIRFVPVSADGTFRIEGLPPAQVWLTALAPGSLRRSLGPMDLRSVRTAHFVVDGGAALMQGRVVDIETQRPVAKATVTAMGRWEPAGVWCGTGHTAEDGRFHLPVARRSGDVHVQRAGYAERHFPIHAQAAPFAELRIRRGTTIRGRVFDAATGKSLRGAVVQRRAREGEYHYQWTHATTDAHGHFVLEDQQVGWGTLVVRHPEYIPESLGSSPFRLKGLWLSFADPTQHHAAGRQAAHYNAPVVAGVTIRGIVLDHEGSPLAGVPIIEDAHSDRAFSWTGSSDVAPLAVSGHDGQFERSGLLPGTRYTLRAVPATGLGAIQKIRTPEVQSSVTTVRLQCAAPRRLRLSLVDKHTGAPVLGARITCTTARREGAHWFTDRDGLSTIGPLKSGARPKLAITAEGYLPAPAAVAPLPTVEGAVVVVALDPSATVRGVVRMPDGSPADGALIEAPAERGAATTPVLTQALSNREGAFALRGLAPGLCRIRARHVHSGLGYEAEWEHDTDTDTREDRSHVITLRATGPRAALEPFRWTPQPARRLPGGVAEPGDSAVVTIHVVDPAGRPVPRASLHVTTHEGLAQSHSVRHGRVELDTALSPDVSLRVERATAEDYVPLPLGAMELDAPPKLTGTFTLTLPPEKLIEGRVVTPEGKPVSGITIRARRSGVPDISDVRNRGFPADPSTVSQRDGRFRLGGLGSGSYVLNVVGRRNQLPPRLAPRIAAGTDDVRLTVRVSEPLSLRVTDPSGAPVAGARVRLARPRWTFQFRRGWVTGEGYVDKATTDSEGRATIHGHDPSGHDGFYVGPPEGCDWLGAIHGRGALPSKVIVLPYRSRIPVRLIADADLSGTAQSVLWRQGGPWHRVPVETFDRVPLDADDLLPEDGEELEHEVEAADGPYIVVPARGALELVAVPHRQDAPTEASQIVSVNAPVKERILLPASAGATLRLSLTNVGTLTAPAATDRPNLVWPARAAVRRQDAPGESAWSGVRLEGTELHVDGLAPEATYTLWVCDERRNQYAYVEGLVPGESAQVEMQAGLSTRVHVPLRRDAGPLRVLAQPKGASGSILLGAIDRGDAYELRGLSPGTWRVTVSGLVRGTPWRRTVEFEAGLDVVVRFE